MKEFKKSFHQKKADSIQELETTIDSYEDKLDAFLLKLSGRELSEEDSNRISQLLLSTGVIQLYDSTLNKHEYNHRNKEEDEEFINKYKNYKSLYSVSKKE